MKSFVSLLAALLFFLLPLSSARADILALKDGRFVEGVKIQRTEAGYKILYQNGEVFLPEDLVKDCFLEEGEGFQPRNEEEKAKVEKGLVPFESRWIPKSERDMIVAKRTADQKRKLEELKAHREWRNRYITTGREFDFEFTIDPEIVANYQNLMETYFKVFTKQWGIQKPSKLGKLKVCFYHDAETFSQVGGAGFGVLAYYRFVPPLELNFYYDRIDPEYTTAVMFHEANHYLTHLVDLDFHYPHCINEAMAEYYGASTWDPIKKEMKVGGIQEGRLTEVLTDIQGGEYKKLDQYLRNELGYDDYTWGWTFVHMMMETPKYREKFKAFFLGLAKGGDVKRSERGGRKSVEGEELLRAFQKFLGIKDIQALEKEWYDYIKNKLKLKTDRGFEQAGTAAYRTGQTIKAKRFYKMAVEKGTKNPAVFKNYAALLRRDKNYAEAAALIKKGLEADPLDADGYSELAKVYSRMGGEHKKEAGRLRKLAAEMDPNNLDIAMDNAMEEELERKAKADD